MGCRKSEGTKGRTRTGGWGSEGWGPVLFFASSLAQLYVSSGWNGKWENTVSGLREEEAGAGASAPGDSPFSVAFGSADVGAGPSSPAAADPGEPLVVTPIPAAAGLLGLLSGVPDVWHHRYAVPGLAGLLEVPPLPVVVELAALTGRFRG